MAKKHNNLRRLVRRSMEELWATWEIAKVTNICNALETFVAKAVIQIINYSGIGENTLIRMLLSCKHDVMRSYTRKKFDLFSQTYDFVCKYPEDENNGQKRIWMCWWQGLTQAPDLTKKCISSIQENAGDYEVIVITENNYRDYVQFPKWIEEKYRNGIISRTHYSDLLRMFLLAEYGGLWLDATIMCTSAEIQEYIEEPLWTIKRPDYGHLSVSCGRFVTGTIGCDADHRWIFGIIRDYLLEYWRTHNLLIDYLVLDYLIDFVIEKYPQVKNCFDAIKPNNPYSDDLLKIMGEPFDGQKWNNLKKETSLFILSWKRTFAQIKNGKTTYYTEFLKGDL